MECEYIISPDEQVELAKKYIVDLTGVGAGNNPVAFLCASHNELRRRNKIMRKTLEDIIEREKHFHIPHIDVPAQWAKEALREVDCEIGHKL